MDKKISVVIPFYKGERYINEAVNSILDQPYKDIEIVLINDGSPTGEEVCLEIANSDSRVKYFTKPNEGIGATRNYGIERASGNYLAFLDQDDVWVKGFLNEDTVESIMNGGDVIGFSFFNTNNNFSRGNHVRMQPTEVFGGKDAAQECKNHHSSMFYSRTLLKNKDVRYALTRHEDVIFLRKALYVAKRITYIDRVMFLYRNNYTSETHRKQKTEELYAPILNSWKELLAWHERNYADDKETIQTIKHMICVYAMEGVEQLYQSGISKEEAEIVIDKCLCRDYLDNYQNLCLSENRIQQIGRYYNDRGAFIREQHKLGRKNRILNYLKHSTCFRKLNDFKKYSVKLEKGLYT